MGIRISDLTHLATPLTGAELMEASVLGTPNRSVKVTTQDMADFVRAAVLRNTVTTLPISSGTVTIDWTLGDYFLLPLTANVTSITFSNMPGSGKGATFFIRITQATTPRTVAWPASFKWEGAAGSVSVGSGAKDLLAISTLDNGTTWDATLSKGRA